MDGAWGRTETEEEEGAGRGLLENPSEVGDTGGPKRGVLSPSEESSIG